MPDEVDPSGEQQPNSIDSIGNLSEVLRVRFQLSKYEALSNRFIFPFFPAPDADPPVSFRSIPRSDPHDKTPVRERVYQQLGERGSLEEWVLFPDDEEIASLFYPNPIDGTDEVSLFHAGIMIGERILGRAGRLVVHMSDIFIKAILESELDPRHPRTGIKFSDHKADDLGLPDLTWSLYPEELQAFALKTWGLPVYTDAELKGEPSSTAPNTSDQDAEPGQRSITTYLRIIRALTKALADSHPNSMKKRDDTILVGTGKEEDTPSGVVGHLINKGYAVGVKSSCLQTHISNALKAE